ncbi:MAG: YcfA-like protein [Deltaproteobacteria bacterium]|nr:YcfA-like protein [Deltaproteobacteria bacterium]
MTQRQKLIEKRRMNPAGIRFREICLLAEHLGFSRRGGKGSHVVYERDGISEILTVQDRKGMAKPYQVKQLLAVMDKYDLSGERG